MIMRKDSQWVREPVGVAQFPFSAFSKRIVDFSTARTLAAQ